MAKMYVTADGRTIQKRKIVQIAGVLNEEGSGSLYALCEDGTLWVKRSAVTISGEVWKRVEGVPDK